MLSSGLVYNACLERSLELSFINKGAEGQNVGLRIDAPDRVDRFEAAAARHRKVH